MKSVDDQNALLIVADRITLGLAGRILLSLRPCQEIRYLDSISWAGHALLRLGHLCRRLPLPTKLDFRMGDVLNRDGYSSARAVSEREAPAAIERICEELFDSSATLRLAADQWPREQLVAYLRKLLEPELLMPLSQVGVVDWFVTSRAASPTPAVRLFLQDRVFFRHIAAHGAELGLEVKPHVDFWRGLREKAGMLGRLLRRGLALAPRAWGLVRRSDPVSSEDVGGESPRAGQAEEAPGNIVIRASGCPLSLDLSERSDLFWVASSGIPRDRVIYYFSRPDIAVTPRDLALLQELGIKAAATPGVQAPPEVPRWTPTGQMGRIRWRLTAPLIRTFIRRFEFRRAEGRFVFGCLLDFACVYAFWYDLFKVNKVRVHVDGPANPAGNVPLVVALQDLGGVSVACQASSLLSVPLDILAETSVDVLLVFTLDKINGYCRMTTPVEQLIPIGYTTDYSFEHVRPRSQKRREQLAKHGARFIVSYFDQNSSDSAYELVTTEESARDYAELCQWVLDDPTLGLVLKPKRPHSLMQRIGSVAGLLDRARATGRVLVMAWGAEGGQVTLPTETSALASEAALVSDLAVGLLISPTATVEALLAGTPAVVLNRPHTEKHPFFAWGREQLVFDDVPSLRAAVEAWRREPAGDDGLGAWPELMAKVDPFKDGRAYIRMAEYIDLLFTHLVERQSPRAEALAAAAAEYRRRWQGEQREGQSAALASPPASRRERQVSPTVKQVAPGGRQ